MRDLQHSPVGRRRRSLRTSSKCGGRSAAGTWIPLAVREDERNLYYGLLGPDAKSIAYTLAGKTQTQATVGPQGAYLIVTTAPVHQFHLPGGGGDVGDDVPVRSPITSIQYRDGATCQLLTARKWIVGFHACSPPLNEPVGYVHISAPTQTQVATPIQARAVRFGGGWEIVVSFKSQVAVESVRGIYELQWRAPGMRPNGYGFTTIGPNESGGFLRSETGAGLGAEAIVAVDIAAGQTLTATIGQHALSLPANLRAKLPPGILLTPGVTSGTVTLRYSTGPSLGAQPTAKLAVGSFSVKIP
jgi:hypothetical protein